MEILDPIGRLLRMVLVVVSDTTSWGCCVQLSKKILKELKSIDFASLPDMTPGLPDGKTESNPQPHFTALSLDPKTAAGSAKLVEYLKIFPAVYLGQQPSNFPWVFFH